MGQAKDRGTIEKRFAQSVAAKRRVAESLGLVRRNLDELKEQLALPSGAPFLGYVVHIPDSDEFWLISMVLTRPIEVGQKIQQ